jgi:hypothetical protein
MYCQCLGFNLRNICFQVVDIMRVNVDKVLERDQKISELDDRAGLYSPNFDMDFIKMETRMLYSDICVT